jgi:hypothetical protein
VLRNLSSKINSRFKFNLLNVSGRVYYVIVTKGLFNSSATSSVDIKQITDNTFELAVDNVGLVNWTNTFTSIRKATGENARLKLLLAPAIAPMMTLEKPEVELSKLEWQGYANHQLASTLGDLAAVYDVELELYRRENPLAIAMPKQLIELSKRTKTLHISSLFEWAWNECNIEVGDANTWGLVTYQSIVQPFYSDSGSLRLLPPTNATDVSSLSIDQISSKLRALNSIRQEFTSNIWMEVCARTDRRVEKIDLWQHVPMTLS